MALVLLPHQTPHWKAVKSTLTHVLEERLTIFQLISYLDRVQDLVHFGRLTDHLLDDLPSRTTFFNLGGFLNGLPSNERHHFQNSILPFLLRCVINLEHLCPESLLCSRKQTECDTFVPFRLVIAVIACAFLCLLRTQWNSMILFDDFNFANFFKRLTDTQFNHEQKLSSLIAYFDHCRQSTTTSASAALRVIRRCLSVSLPLLLPEIPFGNLPSQPLPDRIRHLLVYALKDVPLPCLFTDRCNRPTAVADDFHIPLVYFVNGNVGGNCLGSGAPQDSSPFWLFPDLLACLPICHPLEEFEALWIDHYRGPFLPKQAVSDDTLKWRRLIVMNSGSLPCWASDRQFLESYLLDEVVKATAAFFGLGLSKLTQSVQPPPFCAHWWDALFSREKSVVPTSHNRCDQISEVSTRSMTVVADRSARLTDYANRLARVIIQQSYQRTRENWSLSLDAQPETTSITLPTRANNMESSREYLPFSHLDSNKHSQICCSGQSPLGSVDFLPHTDICVQPRQSLTGSTQSMPTSITWQSSTRSSSIRGPRLSNQSSLRRYSDLSSSDISGFLPNLGTGDSVMDPELLGLVEDEVEVEGDLPPFSSSVVETHSTELVPVRGVSPFKSISNCAKTKGTCERFPYAVSLNTYLLEQSSDFATGRSNNAPQATDLPPSVLGATYPTVTDVPLLDSIIDHWTTQVFKEAVTLAEGHDRKFRGFANALSCSIVRGAIHTVEWGDQYASVVLRQAMAQANQQLLSISHLGRNQGLVSNGRERRHRYHSVSFSPYPTRRLRSAEDDLSALNSGEQKPHGTRRQSRKPLSPVYNRPLQTSVRVFPQVKQYKCRDSTVELDASQTFTLKPNAVGRLSSFDPKSYSHQAEIQVSDRLNRFAESLASGCCISAMHAIQSRWLRAKGFDPDRVRPSGFVTTGWNKHTVNPTADPQLKIITQWIAAAAASACATIKSCGPLIGTSNNQASVSFAGEESPSAWEYHISPVVVCTNNDPRLEQLGAVVKLIYSTDCSAGTLLSLLCDYAAYRRGSMGVQFQYESSLFDYLLQRLHTSTGLSVSS